MSSPMVQAGGPTGEDGPPGHQGTAAHRHVPRSRHVRRAVGYACARTSLTPNPSV
ncbi:hypothetical protein HMPREF1503_0634 [Olsenella uli MSTE5]|nr:hypothetical protein HMPREF1503_0634 [Olsenella uli MSTE5]